MNQLAIIDTLTLGTQWTSDTVSRKQAAAIELGYTTIIKAQGTWLTTVGEDEATVFCGNAGLLVILDGDTFVAPDLDGDETIVYPETDPDFNDSRIYLALYR